MKEEGELGSILGVVRQVDEQVEAAEDHDEDSCAEKHCGPHLVDD